MCVTTTNVVNKPVMEQQLIVTWKLTYNIKTANSVIKEKGVIKIKKPIM